MNLDPFVFIYFLLPSFQNDNHYLASVNMLSYKNILAKPPPPSTQPTQPTQPDPEPIKSTIQISSQVSNPLKHVNPLKQRIVRPRYKSPYTKKETIKWLYYKIDDGMFNYDYCARLYELLKKWARINRFTINVGDDVLFGRFVSLIYLMSSKSE